MKQKVKYLKTKAVVEDGIVKATISSSRRDLVGDRLLPEALKDWVFEGWDGEPLPMLREHQRTNVVGSWKKIYIKDIGGDDVELKAEGELIEGLSGANDAAILIDNSIIKATSIGFFYDDVRFRQEGWDIGKVDIREASLVMWPANEDAVIESMYGQDGSLNEDLLVRFLANRTDLRPRELDAIRSLAGRRDNFGALDLMREIIK